MVRDYTQEASELLSDVHADVVHNVEDGLVWVSGINVHCDLEARRMAKTLVKHDIPTGLVHDDNADYNGGVQFRFGENA